MSDSKRYTFQTYEEFKREHPTLLEQNEELKARLGDALREVQALKAQVALLQQEHKAKVAVTSCRLYIKPRRPHEL
jgi:hypothetical protein